LINSLSSAEHNLILDKPAISFIHHHHRRAIAARNKARAREGLLNIGGEGDNNNSRGEEDGNSGVLVDVATVVLRPEVIEARQR
jgi:hypothetical protein